jgi:hypothetical protein
MSAGKISPSLSSELGEIRNSRIPFNGKPLFESIISEFSEDYDIFLALDHKDAVGKDYAENSNCSIIEIDGDCDLADGVLMAIRKIQESIQFDRPMKIVFGDTLVKDVPLTEFIGVVTPQSDFCDWTSLSSTKGNLSFSTPGIEEQLTVAGFFGLGSLQRFSNCLENEDFYSAICKYFSATRNQEELIMKLDYWLDFGRLNSYYKSKNNAILSRHFNSLTYLPNKHAIVKSSKNIDKVDSEILWYLRIREMGLEFLAPRLLEKQIGKGHYEVEFIAGLSAAEVFIFAEKTFGYWERFFSSVKEYLKSYYSPIFEANLSLNFQKKAIVDEYSERLIERLGVLKSTSPDLFTYRFDSPLGPVTIDELATDMFEWLKIYNPRPVLITHGDLCLGNVFFDDRIGRILAVDPRGISKDSNRFDFEYDIAKLSHSIEGGYDYLASNLFRVTLKSQSWNLQLPSQSNCEKAREVWRRSLIQIRAELGITSSFDRRLEAYLFLTMTPLHKESKPRQIACICNAARIFYRDQK